MSAPPSLITFSGEWSAYEDLIYAKFLETFVNAGVTFKGRRVSAQFRPDTRGKGFSFWHVVSEAPSRDNRNEEDRVPDLRRCERIQWIAWAIAEADANRDGFHWWENERNGDRRIVIWAEPHDFAVVLAVRGDYCVLKTAFCDIKTHRRRSFVKERDAFHQAQKG